MQAKENSLSKNNTLSMGVIKPFGPSIVKLKLPVVLVNEMNEYIDTILTDEKKIKELDHGYHLAGNVNQELLLEAEFIKKIKWTEFIGWVCNEWLKNTSDKELKDIKLIKTWIVRQFKNEYNPIHHHAGHISGVGYLKVPKHMGNTFQESKPSNSNGKLVFVHGSPNLFSQSTFEITPEVGDFYLFPNYLQHLVYPFTGTDEERRSVSFNAILDSEAAAY